MTLFHTIKFDIIKFVKNMNAGWNGSAIVVG